MRRKSLIALLLFAVIFVTAGVYTPFVQRKKTSKAAAARQADSIRRDSLARIANDTTRMDSLQRAIYRHNKQVDDSIRLDSINRQKKNGIDAPVVYSGNDSLVYNADTKMAYLYGTAKVKYENMDLASERIRISTDSSVVHATGAPDSTEKGGIKGKPVFNMGSDKYSSDTMAFNFKSKKGLIKEVHTQQQEGFLFGQKAKRDANGDIYLQHGRYTTCDKDCPDFYIALSRAKVRPGKDVTFRPIWWWPTCRYPLPYPTVSSPSPRNSVAASSCLLTATRANAGFIYAIWVIISPSATSGT